MQWFWNPTLKAIRVYVYSNSFLREYSFFLLWLLFVIPAPYESLWLLGNCCRMITSEGLVKVFGFQQKSRNFLSEHVCCKMRNDGKFCKKGFILKLAFWCIHSKWCDSISKSSVGFVSQMGSDGFKVKFSLRISMEIHPVPIVSIVDCFRE